jgi:hypothetical protein
VRNFVRCVCNAPWQRCGLTDAPATPCTLTGLTPDGQTLGTPVAVLVRNKDQRSGDYSEMSVRAVALHSARASAVRLTTACRHFAGRVPAKPCRCDV